MLTKLLATVGLAGTLMLSLAAPASAHEWGRFHRGPAYGEPVYRGGDWFRFRRAEAERRRWEWERERAREWRRLQWERAHDPYGYRY